MDKLAYYECFKCKDPYFGGMKECGNNQGEEEKKGEEAKGGRGDDYKKEDLVCAKCSSTGAGAGL